MTDQNLTAGDVDEMVNRIEEHIRVLSTASQAALKEGQHDAAVLYASTALVLNPQDPLLATLKSEALRAKGHYEFLCDRPEAARQLYAEARAVPHLPPDQLLDLMATSAALETAEFNDERFEALKEESFAADPRQWLWWVVYSRETMRHNRYRCPEPHELPATPPSAAEFAKLERFYDAFVDEYGAMSTSLKPIFYSAVAALKSA